MNNPDQSMLQSALCSSFLVHERVTPQGFQLFLQRQKKSADYDKFSVHWPKSSPPDRRPIVLFLRNTLGLLVLVLAKTAANNAGKSLAKIAFSGPVNMTQGHN